MILDSDSKMCVKRKLLRDTGIVHMFPACTGDDTVIVTIVIVVVSF